MSNYYPSYNYSYQHASGKQVMQQGTDYQCNPTQNTASPPSRSQPQALPAVSSMATDHTSYSAQLHGEQQKDTSNRAAEEARAEEQKKMIEAQKKSIEQQEERMHAAQAAQSAQNQPPHAATQQVSAALTAQTPDGTPVGGNSTREMETRAMMARIGELNSKDPGLLMRIREEERRVKEPKSAAEKATPEKATLQPATPSPAQQNTPWPAQKSQNYKATSRPQPTSVSTPASTPASTPTSTSTTKSGPQPAPQPAPMKPVTPVTRTPAYKPSQGAPARSSGNTIWPADQKKHLAIAASAYLSTHNPGLLLTLDQILAILDGNPSYIELCEQLEVMNFRLDRAAFAKTLLAATPDVNSASRRGTPQSASRTTASKAQASTATIKQIAPPAVMKQTAPSAVMKHNVPLATMVRPTPPGIPDECGPASTTTRVSTSYPPFPGSSYTPSTAASPGPAASLAPVAETVLMKPESEPPATKEEAAGKRNLSDLVDLTQLSEEDVGAPLRKKHHGGSRNAPLLQYSNNATRTGKTPVASTFPSANGPGHPTLLQPSPVPVNASELRYRSVIKPLDKKNALRRNTYNPATIARDILLACGRHPNERALNHHLDVLKSHISQITNDSDLSTLSWDIIDPGNPPPGYFKNSMQTLAENAEDNEDNEDNEEATGDRNGEDVQHAIPEVSPSINPFMKKRPCDQPDRLPKHSRPTSPALATPTTLDRISSPERMPSVRHQSSQGDADGDPLLRKMGRPKTPRKDVNGSGAAKAKTSARPSQVLGLGEDPICNGSQASSVVNPVRRTRSFKCMWSGCKAELHNLSTLRLHIFKIHAKKTSQSTLDCRWEGCGRTGLSPDASPDSAWRKHVQQHHLDPLSWELGDGPASGLPDAYSSEAYLSDAQGRRVTPRITVDLEGTASSNSLSKPHGHGRPPKNLLERDAQDAQDRLTSQKRRMGGPGMDRGGATLVNDKRRRGFMAGDWAEEELVDVED